MKGDHAGGETDSMAKTSLWQLRKPTWEQRSAC